MHTLFDSHCHLDMPAFTRDRADVLLRARAAGVAHLLVPGVRPATWSGLEALHKTQGAFGILIALGVHPQVVPGLTEDERALALDPARLAEAARAAGAVAIGECGLDGGTPCRDEQERIFRAHVRAACAAGLPLVVHVLRAHDLAPRLLAEEGAARVGGVMHSYSGGAALVSVYARLGFSFSFAGPVTYPGARRPVEAVRAIPDELLLAETDAPDQAAAPHRGRRSEPSQLEAVVEGLARARGRTPDELAALTTANARRLFRV